MDAVWAPPSDLTADERVNISGAVMVGVNPMVFESNLTITPLGMGDVGTYTLSLTISSTQPSTGGTTASGQRIITEVLGMSCDMYGHATCLMLRSLQPSLLSRSVSPLWVPYLQLGMTTLWSAALPVL